MALSFNEFQRELAKRNIDGPMAIILTTMYEQIREQGEQLDQAAKLILELTNTVQGFVGLHEATQGRMEQLAKRVAGEVDGVDLSSIHLRDN